MHSNEGDTKLDPDGRTAESYGTKTVSWLNLARHYFFRKSDFNSSVCIWNSRHTRRGKKKAFKTVFLSLYLPVVNNWMGEWRKRWASSKFPVDR